MSFCFSFIYKNVSQKQKDNELYRLLLAVHSLNINLKTMNEWYDHFSLTYLAPAKFAFYSYVLGFSIFFVTPIADGECYS